MNKPPRFPQDKPPLATAQEQMRKQSHSAIQPKVAAVAQRKQPVAPPVYSPQPVPKVLQRKTALPHQSPPVQAKPAAPTVYRPQPVPKVLQAKQALNQQPAAAPLRPRPSAPPAYRPQPTAKCLQRKAAAPAPEHAANPVRAQAARPAPRPQPAMTRAKPTATDARLKNRAPSAAHATVQRYVAVEEYKTVFVLEAAAQNLQGPFAASLNALMPGYSAQTISGQNFLKMVWPYGVPPWERQEGGAAITLRRQFQDDHTVYRYASATDLQRAQPRETTLLLSPDDMKEPVGEFNLKTTPGERDACVLESLTDLRIPFDPTRPNDYSTHAWHTYCYNKGLDYRQDNQYLKLYAGELGFKLVSNRPTNWNQINWSALGGDGQYLVSTFPHAVQGVGHEIAVVVENNQVSHIYDKQDLTKPYLVEPGVGGYQPEEGHENLYQAANIIATYIYRRPD